MPDGQQVFSYKLSNRTGMSVEVINMGATIKSIMVPSIHQQLTDVVLGFDDLEGYLSTFQQAGPPYYGAVIGRYAGRIAFGKCTINNKQLSLETNHSHHHLHGGGGGGFSNKYWTLIDSRQNEHPFITLQYISPDGESGYPGTLDIKVTYALTECNSIEVNYEATTSEPTPLNITNHSYFNLDGQEGNVTNQHLQIYSDKMLETNKDLIPTGSFLPMDNQPQDFRIKKLVTLALDHSFVTRQDGQTVAVLSSKHTGIKMEVMTDQRCLQVYVGGAYKQSSCKNKNFYHSASGICFETQNFPDAPNHPNFPSAILQPGEVYQHNTTYRFDIAE